MTGAVLFCLLIVGLFCIALEPYVGPYGRFFGVLLPEDPQQFMPMGMLVAWTSVSGLALFILLAGYHQWRSICPLSWFSQLFANLDRKSRPNLRNTWFEKHSYDLRLVTLAISLGIARLLFINSDCYLLLGATILLFGTALTTNTYFTGKTWCHYLCPMGPVEEVLSSVKLFVNQQVKPKNSKCASCSACKTYCPDIDAKKAYWKDILNPARRRFNYSYWGLVLGFYSYPYWNQGTFDAYLSARWSRESNVFAQLLDPGFFFWPGVPKFVAAPLTEVVFMGATYGFFLGLEQLYGRYLKHKRVAIVPEAMRNQMFNFTSSISVVTFVAFASIPALHQLPWLQGIFWTAVAAIALTRIYRDIQLKTAEAVRETS